MATALSEVSEFWSFESACPVNWPQLLAQCGGGFFHSRHGLLSSAAPGEPIYARYRRNGEVSAVALGVRTGCRFSLGKRHAHFPTVPAVADGDDPHHVLTSLVCSLRRLGVADVTMDSFDAAWEIGMESGADTSVRLEYHVSLDRDEATSQADLHEMYRRHVRRGEREGWSLRPVTRDEARDALTSTFRAAVDRAQQRGRGFDAELPSRAVAAAVPVPGPGSGLTVYAASDQRLLAAALIGWANGSAYYLAGGSTPLGYRKGASAWMQWRIMQVLRERGFRRYSLGGTPGGAATPDHPAHGLHRFKRGLGAEVVVRRSARWALSPAHLAAHRWVHWTMGAEPARQRA